MKKSILRDLTRRGAALALAVLMAVPTVYASAGEKKLQTTWELTDGLTYSASAACPRSDVVYCLWKQMA